SSLSAAIAAELDMPDMFLDHLAASLGLVPEDAGLRIGAWAARQPAWSHIVVKNTTGRTVHRRFGIPLPILEHTARLAQVVPEGVAALEGATLCRIVLQRSV